MSRLRLVSLALVVALAGCDASSADDAAFDLVLLDTEGDEVARADLRFDLPDREAQGEGTYRVTSGRILDVEVGENGPVVVSRSQGQVALLLSPGGDIGVSVRGTFDEASAEGSWFTIAFRGEVLSGTFRAARR